MCVYYILHVCAFFYLDDLVFSHIIDIWQYLQAEICQKHQQDRWFLTCLCWTSVLLACFCFKILLFFNRTLTLTWILSALVTLFIKTTNTSCIIILQFFFHFPGVLLLEHLLQGIAGIAFIFSWDQWNHCLTAQAFINNTGFYWDWRSIWCPSQHKHTPKQIAWVYVLTVANQVTVPPCTLWMSLLYVGSTFAGCFLHMAVIGLVSHSHSFTPCVEFGILAGKAQQEHQTQSQGSH